jgi:hypothetical protein
MPAYIQNNPQTKIQSQSGSGGEGAAPETLHTPELGLVLDQSGSMNTLVDEAILGFNTLLDEQRNLKTLPANFSLELFNHTVKLLYDAVPIDRWSNKAVALDIRNKAPEIYGLAIKFWTYFNAFGQAPPQ